jgi:hypothetical protein
MFVSCRQHSQYFGKCTRSVSGWDSAVGIATCCWLDSRASECRWGEIFSTVEPCPASCAGSFSGVKRSESGADHLLLPDCEWLGAYVSTSPLYLHRQCDGVTFASIRVVTAQKHERLEKRLLANKWRIWSDKRVRSVTWCTVCCLLIQRRMQSASERRLNGVCSGCICLKTNCQRMWARK